MAGLDSWLGLLGEAGEEAREVFQDTDMERMTAKHEPPDLLQLTAPCHQVTHSALLSTPVSTSGSSTTAPGTRTWCC
jgi:hypothetical protein